MMIDIIFNFGLEIVIALLFVVIILQHRRVRRLEEDFIRSLEATSRSITATNGTLESHNESIAMLTKWLQRVESTVKTTEEEESGVQLLQEGSKKIH
jgi:hypothetical protein